MRLGVLLLLLAALLLAAPASARERARVVGERQVAGNIVELTVDSPALARTAKVRLITPRGWDRRRPGQRWPVLYLLHGCCDTPDSWTRETDVEQWRELRDVLVVTPEAGAVGWYSDWWNHGAGGPPAWQRFHLREVRRLLERDYGAGHRRSIAGLSMGGLGATLYAARRPGMFRAAASYSGYVHPLNDAESRRFVLDLAAGSGEDPLALWGDPDAQRAIWEAHDPYFLARRLRRTPVFLATGDGRPGPFDDPTRPFDALEAQIARQNTALASRLRAVGAPLRTDFYGPGTHSWPYWERELRRSLPLLLGR